jgi:hypothetical protein
LARDELCIEEAFEALRNGFQNNIETSFDHNGKNIIKA